MKTGLDKNKLLGFRLVRAEKARRHVIGAKLGTKGGETFPPTV